MSVRSKARSDNRDSLVRVLTGDLYVDGDHGCSPINALTRVASAQLRAIRAAMTTIGDSLGAPQGGRDDGRYGWEPGDEFTLIDAMEALGGVTALLHYGPDLLDLDLPASKKSEAAE